MHVCKVFRYVEESMCHDKNLPLLSVKLQVTVRMTKLHKRKTLHGKKVVLYHSQWDYSPQSITNQRGKLGHVHKHSYFISWK